MEDTSKTDTLGSAAPSDDSRNKNERTSFFIGQICRKEASILALIIILFVIAVGWSVNIVSIPIIVSILLLSITTYLYLFKTRVLSPEDDAKSKTSKIQCQDPVPPENDESSKVLPTSISEATSKLYQLKAQCTKVEKKSSDKMSSEPSATTILMLPQKELSRNKTGMLRKCELGTRRPGKQEKVIMVVGATGAGKTTLINGMVNYVLGVDWDDDFRFKMVLDEDENKLRTQAVSQTQWITAYTMHHESHFKIPFTLTIIDTPGFGDTRGIEHDKKTMKQISEFFKAKGESGIDHLTAIGIVVPSSASRLTHTQKFIFDSVLSLFGKDIEENIFLMITFSDGQIPPVLDAIKEAGIPHRKYFKFNNSALFAKSSASNEDEDNDVSFDSMFWQMGAKSFEKFFVHIQKMENKSLQLTKDVLDERMSLENYVQGIHLQLEKGLNKLDQYKTEVAVLQKHQKDIDLNKNFSYEVTEDRAMKVDIPNGQHTTTCLKCNFTCHATCAYGDDADKRNCCAMNGDYCEVCPRKCYWQNHKNTPYRITIKRETKIKTANDLKERYEKAVGKRLTAEALIDQVLEDFTAVQIEVIYLTDQIRQSLMRLDQIALRPNPMTALEYIDILIESERKEHKEGWKERVKQLEEARAQAKTLYRVADENFDPFAEYRQSHKELMKEGGDRINILKKIQGKIKYGSDKIANTVRNLVDPGGSNDTPGSLIN